MFAICATCAVEYAMPTPDVRPICADEREWMVPDDGQEWTDLPTLRAEGQGLTWTEPEAGRAVISTEPKLGIGQTAQLVTRRRVVRTAAHRLGPRRLRRGDRRPEGLTPPAWTPETGSAMNRMTASSGG